MLYVGPVCCFYYFIIGLIKCIVFFLRYCEDLTSIDGIVFLCNCCRIFFAFGDLLGTLLLLWIGCLEGFLIVVQNFFGSVSLSRVVIRFSHILLLSVRYASWSCFPKLFKWMYLSQHCQFCRISVWSASYCIYRSCVSGVHAYGKVECVTIGIVFDDA